MDGLLGNRAIGAAATDAVEALLSSQALLICVNSKPEVFMSGARTRVPRIWAGSSSLTTWGRISAGSISSPLPAPPARPVWARPRRRRQCAGEYERGKTPVGFAGFEKSVAFLALCSFYCSDFHGYRSVGQSGLIKCDVEVHRAAVVDAINGPENADGRGANCGPFLPARYDDSVFRRAHFGRASSPV